MKNIVCFDVETTGLSPVNDYIIQLAMVKIDGEMLDRIDNRCWYIKPCHAYTISKDAEVTHGLTKEFIDKNGVDIKDIAQDILDFIGDCDYLTYNGNSFDIRFLYKDLAIFGFELPIEGRTFYDAFSLYKMYHPSTLSAVYKNYTGKDMENAHDALTDVNATIEVFKHIKEEQGKSLSEWRELKECQMLSPEGSIRRANNFGDEGNYIVFAVGKHKDEEFCEVMKKDPSYIKWFGENVASGYTKKLLNQYVREKKSQKH